MNRETDNSSAPVWQAITNIAVLPNGTNADLVTTNNLLNMKTFVSLWLTLGILGLVIVVTLSGWADGAVTGGIEKWFKDSSQLRAFSKGDVESFQADVGKNRGYTDATKADLTSISLSQTDKLELSDNELDLVRAYIRERQTSALDKQLGRPGCKADVTSFAFGKIGNTRIGVVDFECDGYKISYYIVEASPSKWVLHTDARSGPHPKTHF